MGILHCHFQSSCCPKDEMKLSLTEPTRLGEHISSLLKCDTIFNQSRCFCRVLNFASSVRLQTANISTFVKLDLMYLGKEAI